MREFLLFLFGISAGAMLSLQAVLNAEFGRRTGIFVALLIMTIIGFYSTLVIIVLFPNTSNLRNAPGLSEWYLYLGAFLGVIIMVTPILLLPQIADIAMK